MTATGTRLQERAPDRTPPTRPLRILMGVPAAGATAGGPALHLPMLVEDLRGDGLAVTTFPFGRWAEGEPAWLKIWHQLCDLARYPGLVRRARPDLVHLNSSFDRRALLRDVPFTLATRALGRPLFVKWHGSEVELLATSRPLWRLLGWMLLRGVAGLGVLSNEEREAVRRRRPATRCWVVCNALDLRRYEQRPDLRARLGVPAGSPLLLFIGRLIPAKGLLDVLQALGGPAARHDAHLVVVGDGPSRAAAAERARDLGLEGRVHFTGAIPESATADFYCGCDALVFPTYHPEGFPMTVFQSLAGGLGIVTTRLRATADWLRDPENCLFVPPRDPAALERALLRLLGDAELLGGMRRANRELARRFERSRVAADFESIYAQLLGVPERAGRSG